MRYLVIIFRLCILASTFIYALPIVALLRTSSKVSPLSSTSDSAETWFCRMVSLIFDSLSFWHRVKLDENAKTGSPLLSSSSKFIVICEFAFIQVAGSLSQSSMHAFFTDDTDCCGHKKVNSVRHRFVEVCRKKWKLECGGIFTSLNSSQVLMGLRDRTGLMFSPLPLKLSVHSGKRH